MAKGNVTPPPLGLGASWSQSLEELNSLLRVKQKQTPSSMGPVSLLSAPLRLPSSGVTLLTPPQDRQLQNSSTRVSLRICRAFYVEALQGAGGKRSLGPTPSFPLPHAACRPIKSPHLLEASLDAAVFAGNHLAVPVLGGPTGEAQVGVALSHCQVAGTLLGVALGLTATAREAILTWGGGDTGRVRNRGRLMLGLRSASRVSKEVNVICSGKVSKIEEKLSGQ